MVAHVVLFTPKATLSAGARAEFVRVLEAALTGIPDIAGVRLGRRFATGRAYDALGPAYEYVAILEFASPEALDRYLTHPAHIALGAAFYDSLDRAVAADYTLVDDVRALET